MISGSGGDGFEILGYFAGFWLFVFSRKFRQAWLWDFRKAAWWGKCISLFDAALSVFFGVVLPAGLIWWAVA